PPLTSSSSSFFKRSISLTSSLISSSLSSSSFAILSFFSRSLMRCWAYLLDVSSLYGECFEFSTCSLNSSVTFKGSGGSQSDSSSTVFPSSNGEINNEHATAVSANTSFNLAINYNSFFTWNILSYTPLDPNPFPPLSVLLKSFTSTASVFGNS